MPNDPAFSSTRLAVLVAEDDDTLRRVMRRALENSGYEVFEAGTGKKVLAMFEQVHPAAVLLDAVMPEINGFETCERLRKLPGGAYLPILMITSLDDERSIAKAFAVGATDYLTKPVRLTVLCQRIRRLIQASQAEAQLAMTNAYLQSLVSKVPDGIVTFDERGLIESFNPAAERIFGCSATQAVGKPVSKFAGIPLPEGGMVSGSFFDSIEYGRDSAGASALEISLNEFEVGGSKRYLAIMRDVTERKRAEAAVRKSKQQYEALVNSIDSIVFEFKVPEEVFTFVSQQAERLLGYPLRQWFEEPQFWENHIHPEDREAATTTCKRATANLLDHEFTYRMLAADGREVWLRDIVTVIIENNQPVALRGVMIDVTQQRRTEEALHRSQKMEAVGRLAGGVAHDFNNLLTVIKGYTQLLLKKQPQDTVQYRYIEEIKKSADRSSALIRQLLAFSRRQILQPQVIDLNALLTDIKEMMHRLIGEDIELVVASNVDLGRVRADLSQIEQVIVNLVVNARDAMPDGGTLTVTTDNIVFADETQVPHPGVKPGAYVSFSVSDTGVGMDEQTKSRIYEPFFTTKAEKGTGLGLAMVYGIITQSNGFIDVESSPGQGTTFTVCLPRVTEPSLPAEVYVSVERDLRGTETILLVEDEEQLRELMGEALRRQGYQVLEATNGEGALVIFQQQGETIELLVTDVVMPKMSGPELAKYIHKARPDLRVVFMSGYSRELSATSNGNSDGLPFLWKPFEPDELIRKVREVLDNRKRG
ncbi:MAG: response regulator [Blastocatellia bacterium]|nr:response regulator [Blastocatellia bacterium]